jgi:hypothetical protein
VSVLIPSSKIDAAQTTAMRLALRAKGQAAVGMTMGQTIVTRDLAAYDISGAAAAAARYARLSNATALVARTWLVNDLGFRTVPINTAIGIFGFIPLQAAPVLDAIAFTLGGVVTLAQFWLAPLYADEYSALGYFDPPILYGPQQLIGINLLAESAIAVGAESYALFGYVFEPTGNTVQPDQSNLV